MQKLQDSVFSIEKTTSFSSSVFSYLQPTEDYADKTPLGGILSDSKLGWLALGPKFCVIDLKSGLKVAARTFGAGLSNSCISVTNVVELPIPLTDNSQQLLISLECGDVGGMICVFHINGSQILRCIQTDFVIKELAVCNGMPDGWLTCFDGVVIAGTKSGEIFVFDLNRASLIQALKDIIQGYEHLIQNEANPATVTFLPLNALSQIEEQRDLALENDNHIGVILNENSIVDNQFVFRNPDGTVRMKAKRNHIRVTVVQYIPQLGSLAVGYNFGAFQIWNLMSLDLEYTSQVNVECLPVTHFGFQEPCDDPRAFCYLWVIFSLTDRFEDEGYPLAVMYSFTYQGKRMLSDTKCLYQDFSTATIRFQIELSTMEDFGLFGGRCISCHTYSVNSALGEEGEDNMLNLCHLVWECWGEHSSSVQYGMLLFDLDQWYKDQMPATSQLHSNVFLSSTWCGQMSNGSCRTLDACLLAVSPYCHATSTEEHFYPNSLQYNCICLTTSEACVLHTVGIQRQIISSIDEVGPTVLLNPTRLYNACVAAGLTPLYVDTYSRNPSQEEQRRYLLSVALEARLSRFLKRCAHDWATGSHTGVGCTLTFLIDWCWERAIELKENAKELTAPLFTSSSLPDRNVVRCLEHCVQQLSHLTGLLDSVLTKCCNLVVPDALSEMEEKYSGIGTVCLYLQVVQWFLRVGLLPERHNVHGHTLPYPQLNNTYTKRRIKLQRLLDNGLSSDDAANAPCPLLYIDQLIEHEFGGERIYEMWRRGGSEWNGLYPPPSLYSLLRLYLLPDIAEEHKHSLVLYLLVDYSMLYDDVRYETIIRRLMQFPTMFGLSNTAIKATQAFWHLDHRDFDFALDQLQCLTGNTLSEWQHNVVLSSLLAQKKTQAALQYLHVRKPAPIQAAVKDGDLSINTSNRANDNDKLEDWQSCCNLYLARHLVYEALDVIRMCVQNAASSKDKEHVLNFFFKGCRNTGQLSKILQVMLMPFEEQVFIKYLENCNESQTSDILIMYYLQQARYLEAEQYNKKLKHRPRIKDTSKSIESIAEGLDRENARDTLVEIMCSSLPNITNTVANFALSEKLIEPHVVAPKPMSVFVQAKSPKNTFTYKSSFIQDTIENASETWINKPTLRRGLKRALNVEDTPFICTPKISRTKSLFSDQQAESTPPKRAKLDLTGTPKTPKRGTFKVSEKLSQQMATLLDMPEYQSPEMKIYNRSGADTPQSILKIRRTEERDLASPVDSRYLGESDEELETASQHTQYSDSANKHLRFTIPTASESGSTPSPPVAARAPGLSQIEKERELSASINRETEIEDSFVSSTTHKATESHPLESPPKKLAVPAPEDKPVPRKLYKDTVRGRRSLSISANSSLSDDPNTSIESIADIPITLINPRYSGEKNKKVKEVEDTIADEKERDVIDVDESIERAKTPKGRRSIRDSDATPLINRSRSGTPERQDSPVVTPLRSSRITRSRSRTPELSPRSPLDPIPEQPKQEIESEPHERRTTLSVPRQLRSRSRTPERLEKSVKESPRLEVISESPTHSSNTESSNSSPTRRSLRSRSRTPEVETVEPVVLDSPRRLRSRSKTPEKMSPKLEHTAKSKKSLSRLVLEANTFAKTKQNVENMETEEEKVVIECTPMKPLKPTFMDVTLSPIVNKSLLLSEESGLSDTVEKDNKMSDDSVTNLGLKSLPAFTTISETYFEKSVLHSYQSTIGESSQSIQETKEVTKETISKIELKPLPDFSSIQDSAFDKSVLHSYQSSIAETSQDKTQDMPIKSILTEMSSVEKSVLRDVSSLITSDSDVEMRDEKESQETATIIRKEKEKIGEIEREINEIEGEMSEESEHDIESGSSGDEEIIQAEGDEDDSDSVEEDSSDDEASDSGDDDEIISIKDTESEDSSTSADKLQIDEQISAEDKESKSSTPEELDVAVIQVENIYETDKKEVSAYLATESSNDPLNQGHLSLLTDDNSAISDKSDVNLNYSDEHKENDKVEEKVAKIILESAVDTENIPLVEIDVIVEDKVTNQNETEINQPDEPKQEEITSNQKEIVEISRQPDWIPMEEESISKLTTATETKDGDVIAEQNNEEKELENEASKFVEIVSKEKVEVQNEEIVVVKTEENQNAKQAITETNIEKEIEKPVLRTRKRANSTASNKSTKETEITEDKTIEEPKTPMTRKRSQSQSSAKSETEKTPETGKSEDITTPRRRGRTPSAEVRKIITRRASKELSEKDDSKELNESILNTPRRRSTRSRSKNIDDNASVVSEGSVKSSTSKMSEDIGEIKPAPVRKGRKSILNTKPDLSVIPENTIEESSKDEDVVADYSSSRRLTRHQKALMSSLMETKPSPRRRGSTASRTSAVSGHSHDDDASSTYSAAFDVEPIDRINLLNKEDFDGSPDREELQNRSPDSFISDASRQRPRIARAASETKSTPKAKSIRRRTSVDVDTPDVGSPLAGDSPARSRRASFNRAVEALHTPKGRRTSTDVKKGDTDSQQGSPESEVGVPARRTRRTSTHSNTSHTKPDSDRRTKLSTVEEK